MKIGVRFRPLRAYCSLAVVSGQISQDHDVDNSEFIPDRGITPTVLQPTVSVYDDSGLIASSYVNDKLTDVKWYTTSVIPANEIKDTNTDYVIDRLSATQNRGRITVRKNVTQNSPLILIFTATFVDLVGGVVRRKIDVMESVTFTTIAAALAPMKIETSYPRGNVFIPFKRLDHLLLSASLTQGGRVLPAFYWWSRKVGASYQALTSAFDGFDTGTVKIPTEGIGKTRLFTVKAARQGSGPITDPDKLAFVNAQTPNIGANLLRDPLFRKGFISFVDGASWNDSDQQVINTQRAGITFGNYFLMNASKGPNTVVYANFNIVAGNTYTLTMRYKTTGLVGTGLGVQIFDSNFDTSANLITGTNAWQEKIVTFQGTATKMTTIGLGVNAITEGSAEIEYVTIVPGATSKGLCFGTYDEMMEEANLRWVPVRPATAPVDAITQDMVLTTRYPLYEYRIITPYGSDEFIEIPPDVTSFVARLEFTTPDGVIANPELFWDVNWGGGVTGISRTVNTSSIGLGTLDLNPIVTEKF